MNRKSRCRHAGRDVAAFTDHLAVLLPPMPGYHPGVPARHRAQGGAGLVPAGLAGVLDVGREQLAQRGGILGFKSISQPVPSTANRTVSSAGPPVRSSSSVTVTSAS